MTVYSLLAPTRAKSITASQAWKSQDSDNEEMILL
jgi:hypothetical protein